MTEQRATMLVEDGLQVGMVGYTIWADAMEQIRDGQLPHADEDTLASWEAAGIITSRGLSQDWGLALRVAQEATSGMEIVSTYRDVTFDAMVFVLDAHIVTVTSRAAVEETDEGLQATGVHSMLEVVLASHVDPWRLLRRVLPPLDAVRAQPRLPRAEELEPLTLDVVDMPQEALFDQELFARRLQHLPTLPTTVRDALQPVASVFAYGLGQVGGQLRTSNDAWSVGELDLYHLVPGQPGVTRVPTGQLGAELLLRLASVSGVEG